jgi:phosphoglycerate dehydrogenase-like enzyme
MKKKVLFTQCSFSDKEISDLAKSGIEIVKASGNLSEDELIKELRGCWGYVIGGADRATEKVIQSTDLAIINFYGTGYENYIDVDTATERKIVVANTPKANAYTVAEYTIAHILNAVKRIADSNNKTKKGGWDRNRVWNLKDKTLGIIGMGTIGTYVAEIAKDAFNMNILYVGRSKKEKVEKRLKARKVSLSELMKKSDVVTIHASYSKEAENMIGAKELNIMKQHAVLVNCARAELVDGKALLVALKNGKLATASYDAYYKEPVPKKKDDKWGLLSLPDDKFIITPHTAYNTKEAFEAMNKMVIENLLARIFNKKVPYKVN